jgi:regulator of sirC expression with transglutaminase-like and TPR domain
LDPRNPDLLDTLARTYFNLRRYREMERVLDRLIELDPDQPSHGRSKTELAFAETADAKAARADCEAFVPRQIWVLWLECIRGNHPSIEQFGPVRERLYQKSRQIQRTLTCWRRLLKLMSL